jgi:hypothetical protein
MNYKEIAISSSKTLTRPSNVSRVSNSEESFELRNITLCESIVIYAVLFLAADAQN